MHNINCVYNDDRRWCTNEKIKKTFFKWGTGSRCCIEFGGKQCEHRKEYLKPPAPPPPPSKRIINEDVKPIQWIKERIMDSDKYSRIQVCMEILAQKDLEMERFAEEYRQRTSLEIKAWRQGE